MKLLNFGSLNIDYVYSVAHFVRAGETLSSAKREQFPGGKGLNQSVAFARAGVQTYHAGLIGAEGELLCQALRESGVDTSLVRTIEGSSGHAIIQVTPSGENCILLFGGANQRITEPFTDEVLDGFGAGDWLMLQNEINGLDTIIRKAKQRGMVIVLNPSPCNEVISALELSQVDWLILNETEGNQITGESEPQTILDTLLRRYPSMRVVLTLGSRGSVYADSDFRVKQEIFQAKAVDTTAAGDTFTGYFFASVMEGKAPSEALRIASAASAIAVSRRGAAPSIPQRKEVLAFLEQ